MRLLVKSVEVKDACNDWPLGHYGNSCLDNKDYAISTHYLKSDEIPRALNDSKTTSELVAGLINAFYKCIDVSKLTEDEVMRMGRYEEEEDVPARNPNQIEMPF